MPSKFLYGKKEHFIDYMSGKISPRFSDLSHYSRLENDLMRDDEMSKKFILKKNEILIKINDHLISPSELTSDSVIEIPTRHCYCLCLSNKENDPELFHKFKADTCIEVDVSYLIELLLHVTRTHLPNTIIEAKNITYYAQDNSLSMVSYLTPQAAVFFKPDFFSHEAEHRLAMFFPFDKTGFKMKNGEIVPFYTKNRSNHLNFKFKDRDIIKRTIIDVGYNK